MTTYDNSGALFKNDRKEKETHADYRGSLTIAGREYWLDAWIKEGQKGKFMSLAVKPKETQQKAPEIERGRQQSRDDFDDAPF